MISFGKNYHRVLLLLVCLLSLSACADDPFDGDSAPPTAENSPPSAPYEEIPVIQDPQNQIWRPGYWTMNDNHFVWIAGAILQRPSPTAVWSPARWVQHNYGWTLIQGHWE